MVKDLAPQSGGERFKSRILQINWQNQPRLGLLGFINHANPPKRLGFKPRLTRPRYIGLVT
jgi:hypothetical protein